MLPIDEILHEVARDIFEAMAFVVEQPLSAGIRPEDNWLTAEVKFQGAFSGSLCLKVTENLLPRLTNNMLGLDEGERLSLGQHQDALGELANVVCGNLLARLAGPVPEFDLAAPEVEPIGNPEARSGAMIRRVMLALENGWADITLRVDDYGAALIQSDPQSISQ